MNRSRQPVSKRERNKQARGPGGSGAGSIKLSLSSKGTREGHRNGGLQLAQLL